MHEEGLVNRVLIGTVIILLCLSACTTASTCHLYNKTGKQISIVQSFSDGSTKKANLKPGAMQPIKNWSWTTVRIEVLDVNDNTVIMWEYQKPQGPDPEHWKWKGWWIFA